MNLKGLYKSASYQYSRHTYVQDKRRTQNKAKGNLDHLEKYDNNNDYIEKNVPKKAPKPPAKDYLGMMRAQRLDRESKQTSQE